MNIQEYLMDQLIQNEVREMTGLGRRGYVQITEDEALELIAFDKSWETGSKYEVEEFRTEVKERATALVERSNREYAENSKEGQS